MHILIASHKIYMNVYSRIIIFIENLTIMKMLFKHMKIVKTIKKHNFTIIQNIIKLLATNNIKDINKIRRGWEIELAKAINAIDSLGLNDGFKFSANDLMEYLYKKPFKYSLFDPYGLYNIFLSCNDIPKESICPEKEELEYLFNEISYSLAHEGNWAKCIDNAFKIPV